MPKTRKALKPTPASDPDRWMDVDKLSSYTSFTVQSIYRRVSDKTIPHIRVGRRVLFDKRSIDKWLAKQAVPERPDLHD